MTTTPVQPMSDEELAKWDADYTKLPPFAAAKSLRERLRLAEAEVALARERLGPAGWKMLKELQAARAVCAAAGAVIEIYGFMSDPQDPAHQLAAALNDWRATKV